MKSLIDQLDAKRQFDELVEKKGRPIFMPGDKVKLNYKKIKKDPNYKRKRMDWKMFVGRHREDVFTVEYDPKFGPTPNVVCLVEDKHAPKWLWPIADLIPANNNTNEKV